jgi:hypothetical protein
MRLDRDESTALQIVSEHGENLLHQPDGLLSAQALQTETDHGRLTGSRHSQNRVKVRVQRHYSSVLSERKCEDLLVGSTPHSDFADMETLISQAAQQGCGIARHSLIQHQADYRIRQAALLSSALSSRFAAANASAC